MYQSLRRSCDWWFMASDVYTAVRDFRSCARTLVTTTRSTGTCHWSAARPVRVRRDGLILTVTEDAERNHVDTGHHGTVL